MTATRQQLEARWDTPEGRRLARSVQKALDPDAPPNTTLEQLRQLVAGLPFAEEVSPQVDVRGLHLCQEDLIENGYLFIKNLELPEVRFDYLRDTVNIVGCFLKGAVFDEMQCVRGIFISDFSQASFVHASLRGVKLSTANVSGANFRKACLATAEFRDANCTGASFVGADMRFAECQGADFRGADFTDADLTEISITSIQFDEHTRLQGAKMLGASMDDDFRAFARQAGALVNEERDTFYAFKLAHLDGMFKILKEEEFNHDGRFDGVIPYLRAQREKMVQDPDYDWSTPLMQELTDDFSEELAWDLMDIYEVVSKKFAYYV